MRKRKREREREGREREEREGGVGHLPAGLNGLKMIKLRSQKGNFEEVR